MTWIDRLKSLVRHFLAVQRREKVRSRTASALHRLDDRLLADIDVTRREIEDRAREVAHEAVPVPPISNAGRKGMLARARRWSARRTAIRELSTLDDRLLRDVGIEPGQIGEIVDAVLSRRRDPWATDPVVQLSGAMQQVLVPARHRPYAPETRPAAADAYVRAERGVKVNVDWTPDAHALRERAANESRSPERRSRASAEM